MTRHPAGGRRRQVVAAIPVLSLMLAACGLAGPGTGFSTAGAIAPTPYATASVPTARPSADAMPSVDSCRGSNVEWSALPPVAQAYGRAWNERDDAKRVELLELAWADGGSYVDPTMDGRVVGREPFADHIGAFLAGRPGEYFEPSQWIASDEHHGYMQMRWRLCSEAGETVLDGVDFGELGPDGRIQRATGFFALEPETPRPVCASPVGDWSGIPDIARKWAAAGVSDPATRAALIREIWADDGSYVDPSDERPVVGHDAITERAAGMLWEGAFFEAAAWTDGDDHHHYLRLRWRLCDKDDAGLEGTDYVELDDAGQFARVIGFFEWP